ncbi:hypothetical protein QR98_0096910 [Sarcoptes scabiei]|uniref:SH3 domain-containing protein n=1 Tax=Sarcoptes scabiei TaxID=52283 RepID=A0A132AJF1_SARSC|nr:hypothetical protein QR98_0096910 [Sarcoptes scabiei]
MDSMCRYQLWSNVPVKIIGKTVDKNFFLVKIGSRKGFVPAKFVKETKIHHADSKLADIKFNFDLWEENLRLQSLKTEHVEAIEKSNETSISSSADSVLDDAQSSVATPFVYSPKQTVIDGTTIDEDLLQTITPSSNFIETPVSKTVTIEAHFTGTELNKETVSHNVDELFDKNASLPDLQKQADAAAVDEIKQELKIDDKSDLTENHQLRFVESNKSNKLDQIDENSPSDIPIEEEFSDPQSHLPIDEQAESEKIFDPSDIDDIINDTYENSISNHSEYSISDDDNDAEQHDNSTDNFSDKTLKIDENHNNEPKIQASANESSSLESLVEKPKVKQTEIPVVLDERPDQTNSPVVESDSIDEKIKSESIANEKSIDNERTDGINQTVLDSNQFHHPHIDFENFDHTSPENSTIESSPKRKDELGNKDVPTSAPEMILSKKLDPSNSHKSDDSFGQHSHNFHQSNLNDNLIVEQISSQQEHQHHSHASRHHHQQHHSFVSEPSQSTSSHPADLQHHHPISVERLIIETSDLKHKKIVPPIQQDHLINIDPGQAQKFLKADVHSLNHPSRSTEFNAASFSQESSDSSETISLQSRASSSAQALDYPNEYRANVLNDFVPNTDADQINVERINISAKKKLLAEKIGFVTVIMEIIPDEVELFFESFNVSLHVIICTSLVAFFWCLMKIFIFLINSNKKVRELRG